MSVGSGPRDVLRGVWRRGGGRTGMLVIGLLAVVALCADFIASDLPIVARVHGRTHWLANLGGSGELSGDTLESLAHRMGPGDWMLSPVIAWGPNQQDTSDTPLAAPSARHWLGTDTARRDVAARLVHGSRVSILVGLVAVSIYVSIGTLLGLLAAWFGGWVDVVISRATEAMLTIPVFFLILAVMGLVERAGIGTLMVVIGCTYWTRIARLVRAEALRIRAQPYIEAATALGYSSARIMVRHILPNASGPILVATSFGVASAILIEAALSFLGFGAPDSVASWGALLHGAMGNFHAWWLVLFPGLAIFVTVTAYNVVGEALRDVLDPRLPT